MKNNKIVINKLFTSRSLEKKKNNQNKILTYGFSCLEQILISMHTMHYNPLMTVMFAEEWRIPEKIETIMVLSNLFMNIWLGMKMFCIRYVWYLCCYKIESVSWME